MKRISWMAAALMTAVACGDDDGATRRDSGQDVGPVWMPPDSGLSLRDAGEDSAMACVRPRLDPFPAAATPRCTAATAECARACGDDEEGCADACWAADTTPPDPELGACGDCVIFDLLACFDAGGCQQEVAEVFCCGEANCPPGSAEDCFDVMCQAPLTALFSCGATTTPTCLEQFAEAEGACFAEPVDMDAGTDAAAMDAGVDAGVDAAMDAGVDAAPEGGV
ncbi:MAG: hypothetical protein AAGE52_08945 [Myxococcota bacterium]